MQEALFWDTLFRRLIKALMRASLKSQQGIPSKFLYWVSMVRPPEKGSLNKASLIRLPYWRLLAEKNFVSTSSLMRLIFNKASLSLC
jgi:hypothetical protein